MAIPAYKNATQDKKVLPTFNASVTLSPGQYVVGTYYSFLDGDNDYDKTADYTTLPWVETNQIRYIYPEDVESEAPVIPGASGVVADGNGATDAVAYWVDENTLGELVGITTSGGEVDVVTANSFEGPVTALASATTSVDVSAATAPTAGQVLTATSGTAATWQTPSAGGSSSIPVVPVVGPTHTITSEEDGTLFVDNSVGGLSVVLPTPIVAGANYRIVNINGSNVNFTVGDDQNETLITLSGDEGIRLWSVGVYSTAHVIAIDTESWLVFSTLGTWDIDAGPG